MSATDEPEMPLRKVVASTLTTDRPPRTRVKPTSTLAKATMRRAMPPSAMMAPASTKNGMVSIATLLTAVGDLQHHRFERNADPEAAAMAAEAERIGDRHADEKAEKHRCQKYEDVHRCNASARVLVDRKPVLGIEFFGRRTDQDAFDDEQQQRHAAERNRQIGQADATVPGNSAIELSQVASTSLAP